MNIEERVKIARDAHAQGYNCAQAVFAAYLDILNISKEDAMKCAYGFGRGVGGTLQICGTLTGAAMVIGHVYGKEEADVQLKKEMNVKVSSFIKEFEEIHGSSICGELLGIIETDKQVNKLPCRDLIEEVVRLLEKHVV